MTGAARILIVDDEWSLRCTLEICLTRAGYRVLGADDGQSALQLALDEQPDLVVLDVGLPDIDGLEVCRRLRRHGFDAPVLMLTGKTLIEDRVTGLEAGADDYLPKPLEAREFLARVKAQLRRQRRAAVEPRVLEFGNVRVDLANKTATRGNRPLALTKTEYALLQLLARHGGQPVSRETMLDVVWGYARFPTTRTIDTHVWRLRKKVGDDGDAPRWLKLVHGQGYCLVNANATAPAGTSPVAG